MVKTSRILGDIYIYCNFIKNKNNKDRVKIHYFNLKSKPKL